MPKKKPKSQLKVTGEVPRWRLKGREIAIVAAYRAMGGPVIDIRVWDMRCGLPHATPSGLWIKGGDLSKLRAALDLAQTRLRELMDPLNAP